MKEIIVITAVYWSKARPLVFEYVQLPFYFAKQRIHQNTTHYTYSEGQIRMIKLTFQQFVQTQIFSANLT